MDKVEEVEQVEQMDKVEEVEEVEQMVEVEEVMIMGWKVVVEMYFWEVVVEV